MELAMMRTRIDGGGGSRLDLGDDEDNGGGSKSWCHTWTGEAQAWPPMETVREVRARGGDDDRAAAAWCLSGEEDEMMEGKKRGGDI